MQESHPLHLCEDSFSRTRELFPSTVPSDVHALCLLCYEVVFTCGGRHSSPSRGQIHHNQVLGTCDDKNKVLILALTKHLVYMSEFKRMQILYETNIRR